MERALERHNKNKKFDRIVIIIWLSRIFFILWAILLVRSLFIVQVLDPNGYKAKGEKQCVSESVTLRGDIYDRNGIKLAGDEIYREVYAHKKFQEKGQKDYNPDLVNDHTAKEIAQKLAPILDMPEAEILNKLKNNDPIINLKRGIDKDTEKKIKKLAGLRI